MIRRLIILLLIVGCVFADVISVTGFKNNTSNPKNVWIGESIADNLTTDLSIIDKIMVVSRNALKDILKEQKFTHSGLVEQNKSIEIGKMVGATTLLGGDFTIFNGVLIINAQFTNIESGVIKSSVKVEGNVKDLYLLQKQLAQKVLEELGVDIDEKDRIKISQVSTEKVKALEKNYMGVLALDNNEVDNAIALFKEAVSIDPYYQQAKSNLKSSEVQVSGGLLFASALNLNDKKEKQRDALKLIYDTFIDNYLMVQISGQESVSDMDDPNNVFIEIEFTITQNINVATKFTKDIKNISEGDEPIFDTSWYSWLNSFLFPDDFWLIKSIRKDFKKNNSYNLYKENFDWIREQYIRRPSGITPTSFKKDYRINFLNNNGVFNEQYIYTSLEGGCTSCWRDGWEDVKNDFFYKHYIINLDSNLPPSPKSSSANKYPSKLYLYFKMPLKDVQTITSISIEAVD